MGKSNKIKRFKKEQVMEQQKKGLFGRRTSPVMWILILLSSIMLSLPFLLPGTGWVSLVAFIPLLAAEHIATRERMRLFWVKYYLCFLLWNIFTTFWIYKATLYGAMAAVILNALQMAVIFAMFRWFKRLTKGYLPYLFFIIAWLAWEHAYFNWDVSWPWLVLGNAFATSVKSVQWYEYTGALGGSLWILLINTLLFRVLLLAANGEEVTSVVSIMIPDSMIRERIHHRATIEGRADDAKDETISNRIATYHNQTEPLVEYYSKAGKYNEIDGTGTIDDVRKAIFDLMDRF